MNTTPLAQAPKVLFVHFKLRIPAQPQTQRDPAGVSLAQAGAAIDDAFAGAAADIFLKFDGQSVFVEQDSGFPYLLKLLSESGRYGLDFVVLEVVQSALTLLGHRPELTAWLHARGLKVRYSRVENQPKPNTP